MTTPYDGKRAAPRYVTTVLGNGHVVLTTNDGRRVEYIRFGENVYASSPTGRLVPVCRYLHSAGRPLQAHASLSLEEVIRREARKCFEYGRKPGAVAKRPAYLRAARGCPADPARGRSSAE